MNRTRLNALLLVPAAAISLSGCGINSIPTAEENAKARWADVQNQYQRRADLIPNLVATVKGYAKVEETVLTNIANARAGLMTAQTPDEKLAANDRLNVALLPLLRMQENYPQLKSNDQFQRLEDELAGTENRIAVARTRYNGAVNDYNVYIQQFPNSIWANMAGFHTRNQYYSADQSSREAPKVDFSK
jgi:LemA protein